MNIKNIEEFCRILVENFEENFEYEIIKEPTIEILRVCIYDGDAGGWETLDLYFDKIGELIPNYEREEEIKTRIKQLQEELKKIQNNKGVNKNE